MQRGGLHAHRAVACVAGQPPPSTLTSLLVLTTNESELERRDDAVAFPSEEQRDPGQCLLVSS
jgi:hypothetical protein